VTHSFCVIKYIYRVCLCKLTIFVRTFLWYIRSWPDEYKEILEEIIEYVKFLVGRGIEEESVMEERI